MTKLLTNIVLGLLLVVSYSACAQGQTKNNGDKMKTIEINKEQFLQKVVNYEVNSSEWKYLGDKPAIIDFYASWCGPCKMVAPILEELAQEYADSIVIYKVDTEKERELSAAFGIRSIPTIIFVPMEGNPQVAQGAMGKAEFKRLIDEILLKK